MADEKLAKLLAKRNAVDALIKREQEKKKSSERKNDTRRKVLAGAAVLEWAARDSEFSTRLMGELDRFLVRATDRTMFSLPSERTSHSEGIDREPPKLVVTNM